MTLVMYPREYNMLRELLANHHEDIWARVGWCMAFDHTMFISYMNEILGVLALPEESMEVVCLKYLDALKGRPRCDRAKAPQLKSILMNDYGAEEAIRQRDAGIILH
jgi:hypothetical protein